MDAYYTNDIDKFPKISIVTPSYNQGKYLEATIQSVLKQNYPNIEYIIIDGGSTDNSIEIIKKYESKLAYWVSEKDNGMYDAIQKGLDKSTGDILGWINSDDMFHENAFLSMAEVFSTFKDIEWLTGVMTIYNEKGNVVEISRSRTLTKYLYWSGDYKWIQQESTFFKRSLWERGGSYINKALDCAGDFELWFRFFKYAKLYKCNILIGGFRIRNENQKSLEGMDNYYKEVNTILKQNKLPFNIRMRIFFINIFKITFKLFQKKSIILKLYCRLIDAPQFIYFDRHSQKFKMKDHIYIE